ncbi:MAG: carbohydrate ABC transporter permease [Bacilli bacterium]|nr:carbohydrate ABC transporter permease [Bacilli bacterium]
MVKKDVPLYREKKRNRFKQYLINVFGKTKGDIVFNIVVYAIFIAFLFVCLFPFLYVLVDSLILVDTSGDVNRTYFSFNAYLMVFQSDSLFSSLMFSVLITVVATFLSLVLTVLAAYPLTRKGLKGRKIVLLFVIFAMLFSGGLIPYYLLIDQLNLVGNPLVYIVVGLISPYNIIIVKNFISSLPEELMESARVDGAGELRTLFKIVLPLSGPIIATVALWVAVAKWNDWATTLYYMGDQNKSLWMFQYYLQEILKTVTNDSPTFDPSVVLLAKNVKNSAVIISIIPIVLVYPFIQKYFVKGVLLGSVKG